VGSFLPNRWNVFDLTGNAGEWVADLYHRDYRGAPRGAEPWNQLTGGPTDRERVVRGGGWDDLPARLRVSHREARRPDDVDRAVGFRCVADGGFVTVSD
jgi:formylglycine-generating enzyme required for sulfatase activity